MRWKKIAVIITASVLSLTVLVFNGEKVTEITGKLATASAMVKCMYIAPKFLNLLWTGEQKADNNSESEPASQNDSSNAQSSESTPKGENTGEIITQKLSLDAANVNLGGVHLSNKTGLTLNYDELIKSGLPFKITATAEPQVLIVHTHATEAYAKEDNGQYSLTNDETRTTDNSKNTVQVGAVLAKVLNDNGIGAINDGTQHDHPAYTGSYSRSEETILKYLKKYPSIKVVIDLHRDSISAGDNAKLKPTGTVNGKKAAQIMLLAGCEIGDVTDFPNWKENLRFNLILQKQLEADYPELCRPLSFKECKYNFDINNGSILIEVGSEANTLEEAEYSAELFGKALVKVLSR